MKRRFTFLLSLLITISATFGTGCPSPKTKLDYRLLGVDLGRVAVGIAGEVLPTVEVHMGFEVRLPCIFHGGLERDHEHALGPKFLGKLIAGEGLAEVGWWGHKMPSNEPK